MRLTCFPIFIHGPGSFCFNSRGQASGGFCWAGASPVSLCSGPLGSSLWTVLCSVHTQDVRRRYVQCLDEDQLDHPPHFPLLPVLENSGREENEVGLIWLVHNQVKFLNFANIKWCWITYEDLKRNIFSISYINVIGFSVNLSVLILFKKSP